MAVGEGVDVALGPQAGVDVSGQLAAQPADGIFDSAFLPGSVGVAEVGLQLQASVLPVTAVRSFPWQHDLISLLHFVCELTGTCFKRRCLPLPLPLPFRVRV
jgi:hypothetical protein